MEAKNQKQTIAKICKVFAHKISFFTFVHKIVPRYLSVVQAILSFAASPILIVLPIYECKMIEKPLLEV